ncbi:MAG: phosphonate ABC transporter ATP-binding protein [Phycisphaerales bacterium]|nr:phosphonate ABC transporter ATP-binding protein [Phycisphaerales bacterium]
MHRSCLAFPVIAALLAMLPASVARSASVTFRVTVPASTPAADTVYIAGNFQGWNPGSTAHALVRQADGRHQITLNLADGVPIQFKFTRGTWAKVEKGPNGEEISNRTHTPLGTQTLNLTVANWADIPPSTITGHVEWFEYAPFLGGRRCWVYLPPGYSESAARYPVLYMHDGQNLFDQFTSFAGEWKVDEACEALIPAGEIEPIIVVGIENAGSGRCNEYTPWAKPGGPCMGGGADAYLAAIRDVLMPHVDQRYRTRTGQQSAYMSGSSLGGLVSAYAGYAYDATWGRIAAVSPSYWFRENELFGLASANGKPGLSRFYQDMGTRESGSMTDQNGNGIDDYIEDLRGMRDIAIGQGFVSGIDFLSVEASNHTHSEFYWAQRVPDMLRFLIDPPGADCPADFDGSGFVDTDDFDAFVQAFELGGDDADFDGSGFVDTDDFDAFVVAFIAGC